MERFTQVIDDPDGLINNNGLYPQILLVTAGSIGAGLDSPNVFAVCRARFPTIIFEMSQELGWCRRGRFSGNVTVIYNFQVSLSLYAFLYLNTRLFLLNPTV